MLNLSVSYERVVTEPEKYTEAQKKRYIVYT